jgi:hypothetical protein
VAALAVGERARIILLSQLAASKGHSGDKFRARLIQPIISGKTVIIPAGSLLEGHIAKVVPPRWLSCSGSILLDFDSLTLPEAAATPISATIAAADLDPRSKTRIDSEGMFRGAHPGKLWALINLGMTAGIAKEADDGVQLAIEAIISTATDVSTAGTGRIVGACASAVFLVTRHGRDVVLPKFTEMQIVFNRSVSVPVSKEKAVAGAVGGTDKTEVAGTPLH